MSLGAADTSVRATSRGLKLIPRRTQIVGQDIRRSERYRAARVSKRSLTSDACFAIVMIE
jgi:hypothetical protein